MKRLVFLLAVTAMLAFFLATPALRAQYPEYEPINPYPRVVDSYGESFVLNVGDTKAWHSLHDVELSVEDGGLKILSKSHDPYFLSEDIAARLKAEGREPLSGDLRFTALVGGDTGSAWQVFWCTDTQPHWDEARSVRFDMFRDRERCPVEARLSVEGNLTRIRIDPGTHEGTARIFEAELAPIVYSDKRIEPTPFIAEDFTISGEHVSIRSQDGTIRIDFAKDGSGALVYLDDHKVGVIAPLYVVDDYLPVAGRNLYEEYQQQAAVIDPPVSTRKGGARYSSVGNLKVEESKPHGIAFTTTRNIKGEPCERLVFRFEDNLLRYVMEGREAAHGPVFRPLGTMEQALLSGVEYLQRGEHSSSKADIETEERIRYSPKARDLTMPLMVIQTDRVGMALLYDSPQSSDAVFATPNFLDADHTGHRTNLFGQGQSATIRITGPWSETNRLEDAILWAVKNRGLTPRPETPRTLKEQRKLNLAGFMESGAYEPDKGWRHAWIPGMPRIFPPSFGADYASTVWQLSGEMPEVPDLAFGGAHLENSLAFFLTGRAGRWKEIVDDRARRIRASQQEDGSFRYSGQYLRGHWEDTASGFCGNNVRILFEHWRTTGDGESLDAAIKGAEYMKRFRTPRGAQTWELSLHTPDIMGSAWAVIAYIRAYEATGKTEYLDLARRWALTGMPFVYQWVETYNTGAPEFKTAPRPIMPYATTPVFGATNWIAPNWIGLPVQWCGLDYAEALFLLAEHDPPGEKTLDWRRIAEGILISAEQQQYPDGPSIGLLPDSFDLLKQQRNPADINPVVLERLRRRVRGEEPELCLAVSDDGKHRVLSPFPVSFDGKTVNVRAKTGLAYEVLVDGKEIRRIESAGTDRFEVGENGDPNSKK